MYRLWDKVETLSNRVKQLEKESTSKTTQIEMLKDQIDKLKLKANTSMYKLKLPSPFPFLYKMP